MERLQYLKKLMYFLLFCLAVFVVFGNKPKDKETEKPTFQPIEIVTDVKPDSVFGNKYIVRIKRLELVETEYWLHTDKKYRVGDTYIAFF